MRTMLACGLMLSVASVGVTAVWGQDSGPLPALPALVVDNATTLPIARMPGVAQDFARAALADGWFSGFQLDYTRPQLSGDIAGGPLHATVSPALWLGYRFAPHWALRTEYRYFGAPGEQAPLVADGNGALPVHQHTEGHLIDLRLQWRTNDDYFARSQWEAGVRIANVSVYSFRPSVTALSLVNNRFIGTGPHFDWKVAFGPPRRGFEIFARVDGGLQFGANRGFSQVPQVVYDTPQGAFFGPREDERHDTNSAWEASGGWQLGAGYEFSWRAIRVSVAGGYEVEGFYFPGAGERVRTGSWYGLGSLFNPVTYQSGDLSLANRGPFLQLAIRY